VLGQKAFARQESIKQEAYVPPGLGCHIMKSPVKQALGPLTFAALVCAISLALDRDGLGALAGGMLVAQATAALMSLSSLRSLRALRNPGSASGQLTYTASYRYTLSANQLLACALLVWLAFLLRGGPMLFGGGVFLLALAAGLYRRSRQARRLSPIPVKSDAA
jgi:hypothetical protein